jgi:hypothetical protein
MICHNIPCQLDITKKSETTVEFQDGDIIITERFAVKVTKTGRGWFAEVYDSQHPMNGLYVFGDKWFVVPELVEKVSREAATARR